MAFRLSERLLLLKACIIRRVPPTSWISSHALLKSVREDYELMRTKTPDYYFNDGLTAISQELDGVVLEDMVERAIHKENPTRSYYRYRRTRLGDIFLKCLEPKLASALDEIPMSGEDLLDFMSLI